MLCSQKKLGVSEELTSDFHLRCNMQQTQSCTLPLLLPTPSTQAEQLVQHAVYPSSLICNPYYNSRQPLLPTSDRPLLWPRLNPERSFAERNTDTSNV